MCDCVCKSERLPGWANGLCQVALHVKEAAPGRPSLLAALVPQGGCHLVSQQVLPQGVAGSRRGRQNGRAYHLGTYSLGSPAQLWSRRALSTVRM